MITALAGVMTTGLVGGRASAEVDPAGDVLELPMDRYEDWSSFQADADLIWQYRDGTIEEFTGRCAALSPNRQYKCDFGRFKSWGTITAFELLHLDRERLYSSTTDGTASEGLGFFFLTPPSHWLEEFEIQRIQETSNSVTIRLVPRESSMRIREGVATFDRTDGRVTHVVLHYRWGATSDIFYENEKLDEPLAEDALTPPEVPASVVRTHVED